MTTPARPTGADGARAEETNPGGDGDEDRPGSGRGPVPLGERLFLIGGFLLLTGLVVGARWGVFTPDTRPDLYEQPGRFVAESLRAWVRGPLGLGQSNFNSGAVPVGGVIWLIRTLGAPAWLAVRIWRLLLLVIAAWGIRRYLVELFRRDLGPVVRTVVTVFWIANPYVIVAGNTTPILLPYALLPWTMIAFLRAGRRGGWRWPAVFALGFFAQGGLNAGVVPFFQLLALPAHLLHLARVEGIPRRRLLGALTRSGVLSILVSLYWLAPSFLASGAGASIASSTEDPADVARTSSYAETARGLGQWALYGRSGDRFFLGSYTVYLTNRFVLGATFAMTTALAYVIHRSRSALRLLAVALLVTALPIMVGLFPGDDPAPAGRLLRTVFDRVPASMAFRTTNKVGAVAVLGFAILVASGTEGLRRRTADASRTVRIGAVSVIAVLLIALSTPMWNGSLYPLSYEVPDRWREATAELDAAGDGRVLVVPGGTGGNYRWGLRSPDDLFPSYLSRPVVSRNTVVGAGDPAGNFLTWFDTDLQLGASPATAISTIARYLGADRVLNRNDALSEETEGARPSTVAAIAGDDPDLALVGSHGRPGTDTIPGFAGAATDETRDLAPADADLAPIEVFEVVDPVPETTVADAADLVVVDGDGAAFTPLVELGLLDGHAPVRYAGDLDAEELARVLDEGARIVLTDTNQRRAWDINRLTNASSAVLRAEEPVDAGSGPSVTLWPDDPDRQTIADLGPTVSGVRSQFESFGIRPWGKPTAMVDGNEYTAFWVGGILSPLGGSVDVDLHEPTRIGSLEIRIRPTEPARIIELEVEVGDRRIPVRVPPGGGLVDVPLEPVDVDRITVRITAMTAGMNPVAFDELVIDDGTVRAIDRLRLPRTIPAVIETAEPALRSRIEAGLEDAPMDLVLTRLRGRPGDASDDEEPVINRLLELPVERDLEFSATLGVGEIEPQILAEARRGEARCHPVAQIDGEPVRARIVDLEGTTSKGPVELRGCDRLELDAGPHEFRSVFGWRLEQVRLRTDETVEPGRRDPVAVTGSDRGGRSITVPPGADSRYLQTGIGFDPRWRLEVDGVDVGPPILLDGYGAGWPIDGRGGEMRIVFPSQGAVDVSFVLSAGGLVVTTAIAVLPSVPGPIRRRTRPRRSWGRSVT